MGNDIVIRRLGWNDLYNMEAIRADVSEEAAVRLENGDVISVLPGCELSLMGRGAETALAFRRGAEFAGVAGAGGVARPGGGQTGGWAFFACRLLSARRFALRRWDELMAGKSAEDVLADIVRAALREALARAQGPRLWLECRSGVEAALLNCGWELTDFRPGGGPVESEGRLC